MADTETLWTLACGHGLSGYMKTNAVSGVKPRYIDMDLDEALRIKWESGKKRYRKVGEGFQGDPAEELFQELIDGIKYVEVLEAQGGELPGFHTTLKNMAITLQARERELRRRI